MMYQRDMMGTLGEAAEEELDDRAEDAVDAEEEHRQQRRHDHHHDRRGHGFLAGRPDDLGGLGADLPDEFAGGNFRHLGAALVRAIEKRSASPDRAAELG